MTATRVIAYAPNGPSLGPLPNPTEVSVGYPLNDVGALTLNYAPDAARAALLGQPLELAVEVSWDQGVTWTEPASSRFMYLRDGRDPIKTGDAYQVEAAAYLLRLQKALVGFTGLNGEGNREFVTQKPGAILLTLWNEAVARGALTGMTATWTATQDSAGTPWPEDIPQVAYEPGKDLLAVLTEMAEMGLVDFRTQGRSVQVYVAEHASGMAADRTTGALPVTLRFGRDLTEAPFRRTWEALADTALVKGDNNAHLERTNAGALKPWGRQETFVTASGVEDAGTLTVIADAALTLTANERTEHTFGLEFGAAVHLPFRDYAPGEWVNAATDGDAPQRMRVRQVTLTRDSNGATGGNVVLNDRFLEADVLQARRLTKLTQGATQGGTGTTPGNTPGTGVGNDILAPAKPMGLSAISAAYVESDGRVRAQITLDWNDVTTNADGTVATDVDHYEVQGRWVGFSDWKALGDVPQSTWSNSPYNPGEDWEFRVRAVDTVFNRGAWSDPDTVTTSADTVGPLKPSTPTATSALATGRIAWDGLRTTGAPMDPDFAYVAVHVDQVNNFAATDANRVGELGGPGYAVVGPLNYNATYYARLVPYDTSGNAGTPSDVRAFVVKPLVDVSNFPDDAMEELFARTGHFLNLTSDNFSANLIEGAWLKAGTVTAEKLTIGAAGISVVPNGYMEDMWVNPDGTTLPRPALWDAIWFNGTKMNFGVTTVNPLGGTKSLRIDIPSSAVGATIAPGGGQDIPVTGGTKWYVRAKARSGRTWDAAHPFVLRFHTSKNGKWPFGIFDGDVAWNLVDQKPLTAGVNTVLEGVVTVPADHTLGAVGIGIPDLRGWFVDVPAERTSDRYIGTDVRDMLLAKGATNGTPVTVSVELRTDNPTALRVYPYQQSGLSIATEGVFNTTAAWQTFSFDTTIKDWGVVAGFSTGNISVYDSSDAGGNVYVRNLKVTPWDSLTLDNVEAWPATDDAQITDVGAGKIKTGLLQATERIVAGSLTGARAELNGVGFQAFDAAGVKTFEVLGASGQAYFAGSVTTKAAGANGRVEISAANNPYQSNQLWGALSFYSNNAAWSPGMLWAVYGTGGGVNWGVLSIRGPRLGSRVPAAIDLRSEEQTNDTIVSVNANKITMTANLFTVGDPNGSSVVFRMGYAGAGSIQQISFQSPGTKRFNMDFGNLGEVQLETRTEANVLTRMALQASEVLFKTGGPNTQVYNPTGVGNYTAFGSFDNNSSILLANEVIQARSWNGGVFISFRASAFTVNSDSRHKTSHKPVQKAVETLKAVPVYDYDTPHGVPRKVAKKPSKRERLHRQRGVMAQDLQKVLPDAVSADEDGDLSVDLYGLLATAVAAIQELAAEVDTLKSAR